MRKSIFKFLLKVFFRVKIQGLENFDENALIITNRCSKLLTFFLPSNIKVIPNETDISAFKEFKNLTKLKIQILISPQVKPSNHISKLSVTAGLISEYLHLPVLPIYVEKKIRRVNIRIISPRKINVPRELQGKERKEYIKLRLYDFLTEAKFYAQNCNQTLLQGLYKTFAFYNAFRIILNDVRGVKVSYLSLIIKSSILSEVIKKEKSAGILLPNLTVTAILFFAMQKKSVTPIMINFTAGAKNILSMCKTAQIKTIYTSRQFIKSAKLESLIELLTNQEIIYLEDLKVNFITKLKGFFRSFRFPNEGVSSDPAVILFTSGSEGEPKGVVLSHRNILTNCAQVLARTDFGIQDNAFNVLPLFHSAGFTGGFIIPLFSGMKNFFYPNPLEHKKVCDFVFKHNTTVFFSTDTFLNHYLRYADPYDFSKVRYIFCGAEKLKDQTIVEWLSKFGGRVYEAYGVTETSPLIAYNTIPYHKVGSPGRFVPGIQYRIKKVKGLLEGGVLEVKGENIMKGYFLPSKPGHLIPPKDGWYNTGDVVMIDKMGFLYITGRKKRFIKIGGEMISLGMVESYIKDLWPDEQHAVDSSLDQQGKEEIVLYTTYKRADLKGILTFVKLNHYSLLSVPKTIKIVDEIPMLGSGKIDYQKLL